MVEIMVSGIVVPVLTYQAFNLSFLSGGATEEVVIANAIPVAPYTLVGLSVRVHEITVDAGGSFQFLIRAVNPSSRDGQDFVGGELGSTTATEIDNGTTAPALVELSSIVKNPQSPNIRVVLKGTGPSSAGKLYAILSADLVMKTG